MQNKSKGGFSYRDNKLSNSIMTQGLKNSKMTNFKGSKSKKPVSTSPRRGSAGERKAYKGLSISSPKRGSGKLYSMRDLDYFIRNMEKDKIDKFVMMNFNSMPNTPTSKALLKTQIDGLKAIQEKLKSNELG